MEDIYFKITGSDTYKAVKQYIHNGLGLNKEDIKNEVVAEAKRQTAKVLSEQDIPAAFSAEIQKKIDRALYKRFGWCGNNSFGKYIEDIIRAEVKKQVSEIIKEKVNVILREETEIYGEKKA